LEIEHHFSLEAAASTGIKHDPWRIAVVVERSTSRINKEQTTDSGA
jgi:hypothetical protein